MGCLDGQFSGLLRIQCDFHGKCLPGLIPWEDLLEGLCLFLLLSSAIREAFPLPLTHPLIRLSCFLHCKEHSRFTLWASQCTPNWIPWGLAEGFRTTQDISEVGDGIPTFNEYT